MAYKVFFLIVWKVRNLKEIGSFLKRARIDNGVSLDEASDDLNLAKDYLENLEEGNVRAFKDVYSLKESVREYSKYLGLDPDKVMDEFNDFMFEHTSKISLDDIKEARKSSQEKEEKPKVVSPYTKIRKEKFDLKKIKWKKIGAVLGIILLVILAIFLYRILTKKEEKITKELMGKVSEYHEFSILVNGYKNCFIYFDNDYNDISV